MYHRVLLKISGEALSSETAALCAETIDRTAATIAELHRRGVEIGIVVGGGNILRGRSASHMERNRADHMGMLATAINALALQDALEKLSVPCAVLSAIDMHRICAEYTARDAHRLLSEGVVVVFACGTGSPFFSTDTGASLRAAEIRADVLLLAKKYRCSLFGRSAPRPECGTVCAFDIRSRGCRAPAGDRSDRDHHVPGAAYPDPCVCTGQDFGRI